MAEQDEYGHTADKSRKPPGIVWIRRAKEVSYTPAYYLTGLPVEITLSEELYQELVNIVVIWEESTYGLKNARNTSQSTVYFSFPSS